VRITFANDYTTEDGRLHKAGSSADLESGAARSLILRGKAVPERGEAAATDAPSPVRPARKRAAPKTAGGAAGSAAAEENH
jgi:hypothetical protein